MCKRYMNINTLHSATCYQMKFILFFVSFAVLVFNPIIFYTQSLSQNNVETFSSSSKKVKKPIDQLYFSGTYRFLGFVRSQKEVFPNNSGKTTAIISGDYFREPMFLLKIKGITKENISFGTDLMINSLYKGPSEDFTSNVTLDLGLNLRTTINTDFGVFNFSS